MTEVFVVTMAYQCPSDSCSVMPNLDGGVTVMAVYATFDAALRAIEQYYNKMSGSVKLIRTSTHPNPVQWDYETPRGDLVRIEQTQVDTD